MGTLPEQQVLSRHQKKQRDSKTFKKCNTFLFQKIPQDFKVCQRTSLLNLSLKVPYPALF